MPKLAFEILVMILLFLGTIIIGSAVKVELAMSGMMVIFWIKFKFQWKKFKQISICFSRKE